jgi:hypothetical protein
MRVKIPPDIWMKCALSFRNRMSESRGSLRRPWHVLVVVAINIAVAGCGWSVPGTASPSPHGSSSGPGMSQAQWAAAWKKRGVQGKPPPMDLGRNIQLNVPVANNTGGKVDDSTARRWAVALWRSALWEGWALNANEDIFFVDANLAESRDISEKVFDYDLTEIQGAKISNARVESQALRIQRLTVVVTPTVLRKLLDDNGQKGYEFAWILSSVGPSVTRWAYTDGRPPLVRHSIGSNVPQVEFVAGQLYDDPLMGEIWRAGSDLACDDQKIRSIGACQGE